MYLVYNLQYVNLKMHKKIGLEFAKPIFHIFFNQKLPIIRKTRVQGHAAIHKNGCTSYVICLV